MAFHLIGGIGAGILMVVSSGETHLPWAATGTVRRPSDLRERSLEEQ